MLADPSSPLWALRAALELRAAPAPVEGFDTRWLAVDGLRVHARVRARGEVAVVIVHGVGVNSRYLMPTAVALPARLAVHVPDLPGFGLSDTPPRLLGVAGLSAALVAWLDAAGIERAVLVANSFGCQVALQAAGEHPDRVERLVLTAPTADPDARSLSALARRFALNSFRERPVQAPLLARDLLDCGPRRYLATVALSIGDRPEDKLGRVRCPVLVVRGEHDTLGSARWAERLVAGLPDARLETVPGAAHTIVFNAPREVARRVDRFVSA